MNKIDLVGRTFGKLTVCEAVQPRNGRTMWKCKCSCGNTTIVDASSLKRGLTKSCGCLQKATVSKANTKHAQTNTRLYKIWCGMLSRCNCSSRDHYSRYGGRGIKVCEDWNDFAHFYDWANSNGYRQNLSIDRIDNNGDYSPKNCRWVTQKEQMRNMSRNKMLLHNEIAMSESEWAEKYNISKNTLSSRLRRGWSIADSISRPVKHREKT